MPLNPDLIFYGGEYPAAASHHRAQEAGRDRPRHGRRRHRRPDLHRQRQGRRPRATAAPRSAPPPRGLPSAKAFLAAYAAAGYKDPPSAYGGLAYDAANAIIGALATVLPGKTKVDKAIRAAQVVDAIQATNFDGATGKVAFDQYGDTVTKLLTMYKVDRQRLEAAEDRRVRRLATARPPARNRGARVTPVPPAGRQRHGAGGHLRPDRARATRWSTGSSSSSTSPTARSSWSGPSPAWPPTGGVLPESLAANAVGGPAGDAGGGGAGGGGGGGADGAAGLPAAPQRPPPGAADHRHRRVDLPAGGGPALLPGRQPPAAVPPRDPTGAVPRGRGHGGVGVGVRGGRRPSP